MSAESLSAVELAEFHAKGWIGAFPLLSTADTERLWKVHEATDANFVSSNLMDHQHANAFDKTPWFKSRHAHSSDFYEVAAHPAIVNRVVSILGPDVLAWGLSVMVKQPGQTHRWHVDVEHRHWPGVTVFIGLRNISLQSSLKVLSGTHKLDVLPQTLGPANDDEALAYGKRLGATAQLEAVDMKAGDFFIFDGHLWHGSHNASDEARAAIIIQYCRPNSRVQIPLNFDDPITWHPSQPPCALVAGRDTVGINRLIGKSRFWNLLRLYRTKLFNRV